MSDVVTMSVISVLTVKFNDCHHCCCYTVLSLLTLHNIFYNKLHHFSIRHMFTLKANNIYCIVYDHAISYTDNNMFYTETVKVINRLIYYAFSQQKEKQVCCQSQSKQILQR